jgi:protein-S-isoprenylcysteine O-methyltransferase
MRCQRTRSAAEEETMRKSSMLTTGLAYLLLGLFFTLERRLRQGQSAQSLDTDASDRNSTRLIGGALLTSMLAMLLAPLLNRLPPRPTAIPAPLGWAGLGLMLSGIGVCAWANKTLGAFYTRTLRVTEEQHIVETGPYRLVRHPGYTGSMLLWLGAGLATMNWLITTIIAIVTASAYIYRIQSEEIMLEQSFGDDYHTYQRRTWKLFPPIY